MEMREQELVVHVERLSREIRRWKRASLGVLIVVSAMSLSSLAPRGIARSEERPQEPEVLTASRVRLVDAAGRIGVEIDAESITVIGAADEEGKRLLARLQPSGLDAWSKRGDQTLAVLEVNTKELDLIDYARGRRAAVTPSVIGIQLGIQGLSESPASWVASLRDSGFEVQDRKGRLRARMGDDGRAPGLVLYDEEGRSVWKAP